MPLIVWKGHLTFGLVSIPVKLFRAARRERVRLHYVHRPDPEAPDRAPMNAPLSEPVTAELRDLRLEPPPSKAQTDPALPPSPVSRVHQSLVTDGDQPLSRAEVFRGYEVEPINTSFLTRMS